MKRLNITKIKFLYLVKILIEELKIALIYLSSDYLAHYEVSFRNISVFLKINLQDIWVSYLQKNISFTYNNIKRS